MPPARAADGSPRRRRCRGGRDPLRPAPAACRSAVARARPSPTRRARCGAGRRYRRGFPSLEFQRLARDLYLVAVLRARLAQRPFELLLVRRPAHHPETAVGAKDAEGPARIRLRPVDEEIGESLTVVLRR